MSCLLRVLVAAVMLAGPIAAPAQETVFPLTVEHALGTVTIPAEPERVIALMDRDVDTLLALGVVPVAIRSWYNFEAGAGPWSLPLLEGHDPVVWMGRELNYEAVAAQQPDLIVFANSGGEQDVYDRLSQIAPTIGLPKGATPWGATTEQTTMVIAEAVGRRDEGQALLDELNAYFADQKADHPEFSGHTATYLDIYPGGVSAYTEDQFVNAILTRIGFSATEASLAIPDDQSSVEVSAELLADFDADIVLIYPFQRTLEQIVEEQPIVGQLESVRDGRAFILQDLAFSTASVLSIPYALDSLVPSMSAALVP